MDILINVINAIENGIFWLFVNDNYKIVFFFFIIINLFLLYLMLLSGLELRWLKVDKVVSKKRKKRIEREIVQLINCEENSIYDIDEMVSREKLFNFPVASFIKVVTNSFTGLGVLGTFVGLQMALEQFNASEVANFNFEIITSMTIALKSSILGIFLSFVFVLLLKVTEIYLENSIRHVKELLINRNPHLSPNYQFHRFGEFMNNMESAISSSNDLKNGQES